MRIVLLLNNRQYYYEFSNNLILLSFPLNSCYVCYSESDRLEQINQQILFGTVPCCVITFRCAQGNKYNVEMVVQLRNFSCIVTSCVRFFLLISAVIKNRVLFIDSYVWLTFAAFFATDFLYKC